MESKEEKGEKSKKNKNKNKNLLTCNSLIKSLYYYIFIIYINAFFTVI